MEIAYLNLGDYLDLAGQVSGMAGEELLTRIDLQSAIASLRRPKAPLNRPRSISTIIGKAATLGHWLTAHPPLDLYNDETALACVISFCTRNGRYWHMRLTEDTEWALLSEAHRLRPGDLESITSWIAQRALRERTKR